MNRKTDPLGCCACVILLAVLGILAYAIGVAAF